MSRDLLRLLLHLLGGAALAVLLVGVASLFDLLIPLPVPLTIALAGAAVWWIVRAGADRAEATEVPALDLDADYALPHAQDTRVRRLEDLIHGAQASRRMTSRGLARTLGDIADERAHDPAAPPPSAELARLIATARQPDAEAHPLGPIDRRTLHRYLRELATGDERPR